MNKQLIIGTDHSGVDLKNKIVAYLTNQKYEVTDVGTNSYESVDYPDVIHQVASNINNQKFERGIIICGSGNGAAITANKYLNVRSGLCWDLELTKLARQHNDANVLCLPARFITEKKGLEMVDIFLNTDFEGGRHEIRIDKIKNLI